MITILFNTILFLCSPLFYDTFYDRELKFTEQSIVMRFLEQYYQGGRFVVKARSIFVENAADSAYDAVLCSSAKKCGDGRLGEK